MRVPQPRSTVRLAPTAPVPIRSCSCTLIRWRTTSACRRLCASAQGNLASPGTLQIVRPGHPATKRHPVNWLHIGQIARVAVSLIRQSEFPKGLHNDLPCSRLEFILFRIR